MERKKQNKLITNSGYIYLEMLVLQQPLHMVILVTWSRHYNILWTDNKQCIFFLQAFCVKNQRAQLYKK